eukprot:6004328-Amphidinium_carterae.1
MLGVGPQAVVTCHTSHGRVATEVSDLSCRTRMRKWVKHCQRMALVHVYDFMGMIQDRGTG